jgi:DNA-binding beta-propeller fold protein YncE
MRASLVLKKHMRKIAWVVMLVLSKLPVYPQSPVCDLKSGPELSEKQQKTSEALLASAPDKAAVRYNMAVDYAQAGNHRKVLFFLERALAETPWLDPEAEAAFKPLHDCPAFRQLVARVHHRYPPVAAGRVIRTIPQKDLIPEGLASDPVDGTLYLSSIYHRKIVKIAPDGSISDFVAEGQDGLLGVLGLKVDARDRSVWAAAERGGEAALFHFDRTGKTLSKYAPREPGKHLFNDLVITARGDVFVTDSEDGSVYKLPRGTDQFIRIDLQKRLYPNGIALSADEAFLYVAHGFGIVMINLSGGSITELQAPRGISLAAVDGLYLTKGSLIAIQNGFGANRIVRLRLSPNGRSVLSGRLLEFRSDNLDLPTTGTILNGSFYYIVNSQIDHEDNGKLTGEDHLQPVRIAVIRLD